jgi:Gpi18-like mannosyltransferase
MTHLNRLESLNGRLATSGLTRALALFLAVRVVLSVWAVVVLTAKPVPTEPDAVLRPYLGEPALTTGWAGWLLGPWQRFDTMRYLRIAREGYAAEEDSVFPPIYPLTMWAAGSLPGDWLTPVEKRLLAGITVSNLAFIGLLLLLYREASRHLDAAAVNRALLYIAIFPTGFFWLAAYTESLFMLLVVGTFWLGRHGRFWLAGLLGFLAALTRLTGWVLVIPLLFQYAQQRQFRWRRLDWSFLALFMPALGFLTFLFWRPSAGLPAIDQTYRIYWHQTTGIPGADLLTAVQRMVSGQAASTLYFDFFCAFFLFVTTILVFRRFGMAYGLYSALLLFFMLLPTSELKPLFSFRAIPWPSSQPSCCWAKPGVIPGSTA